MSRRWIAVAVVAVLGFIAGLLYARLTQHVVPTVLEERAAVPMREVPAEWPFDRFSPGHSEHVLNQGLRCDLCHDPSLPSFQGVEFGVCTSCHLEQVANAHVNADGAPTDCTACHAFRFNQAPFGPWDCARCHGPFNTETHTGLAMHNDIACANCHSAHDAPSPEVTICGDCHRAIRVEHGNTEISGSCVNCHGGHKLALEAAACMQCHGNESPRVPKTAVFSGGHDACADCHRAHAFDASMALACETCHRDLPVLAETAVPEHRRCEACHQPHSVRGADDRTCRRCHGGIEPSHPQGAEGECLSCHVPHPPRPSDVALLCSDCHENARNDRAFHAGGTPCIGCHRPHDFDLSALGPTTLCHECHSTQESLTRQAPGHADCWSCHRGNAHELEAPVSCATCHADLRAASPEGHRECLSCHEPHGGTVTFSSRCTSCHESLKLPGLHQVGPLADNPGHADCATCHEVHTTLVRADRASCMECHVDMADHQPDANVCTGCHTFIGGARLP